LSGHCLDRLADIEPNSIQVCVTSPPFYGLRNYQTPPQTWPDGWIGELGQEPTLALYLDHLLMVFDGVRRVLRDDGTCFVNLGDSYSGSGPSGAGYQSETTKRRAGQKADGSFRISPRLGVGDPGYATKKPHIMRGDNLKPKDLMLIPHRFAIAMQDAGWWVRNDLVWAKTACMPESVTDRATRSHEYIFHFAKSARYYYDAEAVKEPAIGASRVRADVVGGNKHNGDTTKHSDGFVFVNAQTANQRTVWTIGPEPLKDEHYAAWPTEIPRRCIIAGSKPGDTILDPFIGSGRTGIVADRLDRHCIGIELSPANVAMSERLIRGDSPMFASVEVA
jgi:DNA modification methylase